MSKTDAVEAMAVLTAAYSRNLSEQTLRIYVGSLEDISRTELMRAVRGLVATSKFLPSIAEIREQALAVGADLIPTAYEAWGEIVQAARMLGRNQIPKWSHPAIGVALNQVGGFRQVCDSERPEITETYFIKAYNLGVERDRREALIPKQLKSALAEIGQADV
jgi:hypothetical protein